VSDYRSKAVISARGTGVLRTRGFTLIELLVVIAVIAILASLILPALARAKAKSRRIACLSNLHQVGVSFALYLSDNSERFPDRRDLKNALGYKPWTTWPPSDPRGGWAGVVLQHLLKPDSIWVCPEISSSPLRTLPQCRQEYLPDNTNAVVVYWLWRFDHQEDPVPLDNFWGKTAEQCIADLRVANNPQVGVPGGPSDVEFTVDPYFPATVSSLPSDIRGKAIHRGGRNRLCLDFHADFIRDSRLQ
jgi:prepilin-type N-terminal cleavage/methylation domain-containing protein